MYLIKMFFGAVAILFILYLLFGGAMEYKALENPTPDEEDAGNVLLVCAVIAVFIIPICYTAGYRSE